MAGPDAGPADPVSPSGCLTVRLRSYPLNLDQVMLVRKGKRVFPYLFWQILIRFQKVH